MKIFSTFDTNFREGILKKEQEKFWKDKVMLITHDRFFYYFSVVLPAIILLVLAVVYWILLIYLADFFWKTWGFYWVTWFIFFVIIFFPIWLGIFKKYIDYILDFVVVTPDKLIYYNQEGIFSRKWRTIDAEKIKTITVNKSGIIRSIFNFWNIIILTEWDEQWEWEINFKFVDDPDNVKFRISEIIDGKNRAS